jgi:hypothetical protein
MYNEKMAEVVKIIGILEEKLQTMEDKQKKFTKKVDETIVRTKEVLVRKEAYETLTIV